MRILILNGSPKKDGNTAIALHEMEKVFAEEGIETEIVQVGSKPIRGCIACGQCFEKGRCVFDDLVNQTAEKFKECDGLVVGSPVYYASANATLVAFLTRLFYSTHFDKTMKVGAAVAVARRGGTTAALDGINKYFGIAQMPVAGSTYWNMVHGLYGEEASQDEEGMQTMRNLARNMIWMMRCFKLGRESGILYPETETNACTNFIKRSDTLR